jgi:RimJ/RimL family protein N-acetyltransferase
MKWFRPATLADAPQLLVWFNDATVRAVSSDPKTRELDEHCEWLAEKVSVDRPFPGMSTVLIFMDDLVPIGQGRIDVARIDDLSTCLVSYSLDRGYRGEGLGKVLVGRLVLVARAMGYRNIKARIKRTNLCSVKTAMTCGIDTIELFA